jgi:hypothetical protein
MHAADHAPEPIIFALAPRRPSTHAGLDQGVGDGGRLAAAFGADEEKILPAQRDRLHRPFRRVVVRLQAAMVEVGPQLPHTRARAWPIALACSGLPEIFGNRACS